MPEYDLRLPDGRVVKVTGPQPPPPNVLDVITNRILGALRMPQVPTPVYGPPTAANLPPPPRERGWFDQVGDFLKGAVLGVDLTAERPTESTAQGLGGALAAALPIAGGLKAVRGAPLLTDVVTAPKDVAVGGQALGSLAKTIKPTETPAVYSLVDPTLERVSDIYKIGRSLPTTSNWAGSAADELVAAFGGDREAALRWARIWGATSPNTSVPRNTQESVSALIYALEHPGQPLTVEMAQTLPQGKITMAPSKVPNLNRALTGEPLSGDKVEAMAGFMTGEPRIPLDVHALYAVGSARDKLQPELPALRAFMARAEGLPLRGSFTETDLYLRYDDALRRALQDLVPGRSVNQTFAELWEGARAHKGLKVQGGPIDILRKKGLLEAGAMLDPERLKAALRQQGWTAGAIAGLLAALGASETTSE